MGRRTLALLASLSLVVLLPAPPKAEARARHRAIVPWSGSTPTPSVPQEASAASLVDVPVACSCTSTSSCPVIATMRVGALSAQPLYCNQLHGAVNPGTRRGGTWFFQCAELANRWLVESVGAPRIEGNADAMCGNADRRAFDVHTRADGYEPTPGDLLVWDGYTMGHVAVVTSVSPSRMLVANQNYGRNGQQYPSLLVPRTRGFFGSPRGDRGLSAKCVIHPKRLPRQPNGTVSPASSAPASAGPCARVRSAQDGPYCGASRQNGFSGGDPTILYTCRNGATTARRCRSACVMEPAGKPDHCD
ncbi:MAG: CHAP domain-containing protein [Myxococcales bacterium]|nr:CHAP domain-containing protein [Myxococcales bacterium]